MSKEPGPVFLDVGKIKKRALKELEQGRGRLMDEIERTMREATTELGAADEAVELVPVVIVFGSKRKRKKRKAGLLGGA